MEGWREVRQVEDVVRQPGTRRRDAMGDGVGGRAHGTGRRTSGAILPMVQAPSLEPGCHRRAAPGVRSFTVRTVGLTLLVRFAARSP
jgi:hypothetical protein